MRRALLVLSLLVTASLASASTAAAQSPQTLDGQTIVALFSQCNNDIGVGAVPPNAQCTNNPRPSTVEATCDEDGTSTLRYDITAVDPQTQGSTVFAPAFGPYNGTFREDGTITIGPQDQAPVPTDPTVPFGDVLTGSTSFDTGPLLTWTARFEINTPDATVVGTKTLTAPLPGYGVCSTLEGEVGPAPDFGFVPLTGYFYMADATLSYTATITTEEGVFRDRGTAVSDLRETFATYGPEGDLQLGADVGILAEIFSSDLETPEPAGADACKKGGYLGFGGLDFKNQGDCVSFFATDGGNQPAG